MLRKWYILAILGISVTILSTTSYANAETSTYEEHRFHLEFPSEWS